MTLAFGICLAVGAVTVLFSLFAGGGHGADVHGDVSVGGADAPADAAGHDAEAGGHDGAGHEAAGHDGADFWLLFLSMRFWVFLLTFFGLTGLLLELAGASATLAALIAAPTGLGLGLGAAWFFHRLRDQTVDSALVPDELVGMEAKVLLPVGGGAPGKVRLQLRGMTVERIAFMEGEGVLARGEKALVIALRGEKLVVSRAGTPELGDGSKNGTDDRNRD